MSEDLIKRADAIDAIECVTWYHQNRNKDMVSGANSDEHQAWYKSQDIYEALENIPSADRPQGGWEDYDRYMKRCSKCGWIQDILHFGSNFCPNCGCRMKGADDE